jgi:hypothetical protein
VRCRAQERGRLVDVLLLPLWRPKGLVALADGHVTAAAFALVPPPRLAGLVGSGAKELTPLRRYTPWLSTSSSAKHVVTALR